MRSVCKRVYPINNTQSIVSLFLIRRLIDVDVHLRCSQKVRASVQRSIVGSVRYVIHGDLHEQVEPE